MLNFGYWDNSTIHPIDAQKNLCRMVGDIAEISSASMIADVGSGILGPAKIWNEQYPTLQISAVNVNFSQLSSVNSGNITKLNSDNFSKKQNCKWFLRLFKRVFYCLSCRKASS